MASSAALALPEVERRAAAPVVAPGLRVRVSSWLSLQRAEDSAAWDELAARASEPNPFFEAWYLLPALRALDPMGEAQVLRFEQGGELLGLLPLARMPRYYRWPLPHLSGWIHANCFLGAPLVAQGSERAFWEAVLAWADREAARALFLHLPQLPLDGPLHAALQAVCADQARAIGTVHREDRALLASNEAREAYFDAALSAKKRKELRRQFTRLSELGAVALERRTDEAGLAEWIAAFLALERSGWKGSAGTALASHEATAALFRTALAGAAARGKLERLTLRLDGEPIAMLATFRTPPGAFSYKTAFDERFARFSPGVLLQRENLAVLDDPAIAWSDSCAAADHPMIDHLWRERRAIGRVSVAIGGPLRRKLFAGLLRAELARNPTGVGQ